MTISQKMLEEHLPFYAEDVLPALAGSVGVEVPISLPYYTILILLSPSYSIRNPDVIVALDGNF